MNSRPTPELWPSMDPLGEALHFLRMDGVFYSRGEFTAPWGIDLPPIPDSLMFHLVTAGRCVLAVDGAEPLEMQAGDFALVPHGAGHLLSHARGAKTTGLFDLPRERVGERYEIIQFGGGEALTRMICGAVRFDHPAASQLVKLLPPIVHVPSSGSTYGQAMSDTLRLMAGEVNALRPGGETIVTRLADILVIQAIRAWMERAPDASTGWLGALRDRQIGRAILLIHRDSAQGWTLASLASAVAMSRSAFAARFTALVGVPAMEYVTHWRMHSALTHLREGSSTIGSVATRLGYQSEAAFSRTFKRVIGEPPGAVRRRRIREAISVDN